MTISSHLHAVAITYITNSQLLRDRVEILPQKEDENPHLCSCKLNLSNDSYLQERDTANKRIQQILTQFHRLQKFLQADGSLTQLQIQEIDISGTKASGRSLLLSERASIDQETKEALTDLQKTVKKIVFCNTLASFRSFYNLECLKSLEFADFRNCPQITYKSIEEGEGTFTVPHTMKYLIVDEPLTEITYNKMSKKH